MKYKYLLFDLDNTLLDFTKGEKQALVNSLKLHNINIDFELFYETYHKINKEYWHKYELKQLTMQDIFDNRYNDTFKKLSIICDGIEFEKTYRSELNQQAILIDGALETLEKLKDYEIYILTNGKKDTQRLRIKSSKLDKYIKKIYISEEIGYQKPDKEFFDYVARDILGFEKEKALMIGDTLSSDILGANNYSIASCYYNYYNIGNDTSIKASYTIQKLSELLDLLVS